MAYTDKTNKKIQTTKNMSIIKNSLIGGLSAIISRTATAPFEYDRITKQTSTFLNQTLRKTIQQDGIHALWKGNGINCIRIFPQYAINLSVFRYVSNINPLSTNQNREWFNKLVYGTTSGVISMFCIYPFETLRTRFALQTSKNKKYNGLIDAIHKTSLRELYGGVNMTLIGFGLYNGFNFMFYNEYKKLKDKKTNFLMNDNITNFLIGGLSGMSAVSITYPTDLIRRRMQLRGFDSSVPVYANIKDAIIKIYKQEGIQGFYKGLLPTYMKIFPASAIQFMCMDFFSDIL